MFEEEKKALMAEKAKFKRIKDKHYEFEIQKKLVYRF
jgi:hypothetical protein